MTLRTRCLLVLLTACFCADAAAQGTRLDPLIAAIDADADGTISAAELKNAAAALRKLDANNDGTLSRNEVTGRGGAPRASSGRGTQGRGGSQLGGYTTPPPANDVPQHPFDIIIGRLTDHSATVRVLCYDDVQAFVHYRAEFDSTWEKTSVQTLRASEPFDFQLDGLKKDSRYFYRLHYQTHIGTVEQGDEFTFHTQRAPGSPYTFTVQADSHLDENTSGEVYLQTLANALSAQPDFHFALGDTFMTGKYVRPELAHAQYLAQRYYLGHLCHSAGLYFALGNHDGELGNRGSNEWATKTRKTYLPRNEGSGRTNGEVSYSYVVRPR